MKKFNSVFVSTMVLFILIGCGEVANSNNSTVLTTQNTSSNESNEVSVNDIESKELFSKCMGCHGKNGEVLALDRSRVIGGEDKSALLYQLREYKARRLDQYGMGGLMTGQVREYSDSELVLLSNYISTLSGLK